MEAAEGLEIVAADGVVAVTVDTGDGENRFSSGMLAALAALFENPPDGVAILSISSVGPAFCLGPRPPGAGGSVRDLGRAIARLNRAMAASDLVSVAAVNGRAAGFGMGLACLPDITIAGPAAVFVCPEIEHRLSPALVLSWMSEYIGPKAAAWLTLTGTAIDAATAAGLGLVSFATRPDHFDTDAAAVVDRMRSFDQECLLEIRRFLRDRRGIQRQEAEALAIERMGEWADIVSAR